MAKTKSPQPPKIVYAGADTPPLEYADFVRLSSGPNGVVFGFGQNHPHRSEVALTYEVIVPYPVAVKLHDILGKQLSEIKKIIDEQVEK